MRPTVPICVACLALSVLLTAAGRGALGSVFRGDESVAQAADLVLLVGFSLADLGFIALWLRGTGSAGSVRGVFSALSVDVGTVLLVLGAMHLGNVLVLDRLRRRTVDGPAV